MASGSPVALRERGLGVRPTEAGGKNDGPCHSDDPHIRECGLGRILALEQLQVEETVMDLTEEQLTCAPMKKPNQRLIFSGIWPLTPTQRNQQAKKMR